MSRRVLVAIGFFFLALLAWGGLAGFDAAARCGLFLFAALVPLIGGGILIYRRLWYRQWLAAFLLALLIGFVAFEVAFIGILTNQPAGGLRWVEALKSSAVVGLIALGIAVLLMPVSLAIYRYWRPG